ncbi:uncharacterized protein LOC143869974 [Tasmannia lanceolata]|uniref:uncharacterized protein LOC143869974 n=1 Tax=Tasmannia lanceolata TaxID=3420 RepID=UPI004064468C
MDEFNCWIDNNSLSDLRSFGQSLSWNNRSNNGDIKLRRLDRALINEEWLFLYPSSFVSYHLPGLSDHSPMITQISNPSLNLKKPFKFFSMWLDDLSIFPIVERAWNKEIKGTPLFRVYQKLREVKAALRIWNHEFFGRIDVLAPSLCHQLTSLQTQIAVSPLNQELRQEERSLKDAYIKVATLEEKFYRQKSRINWLNLGDSNSSYFHSAVKARSNQNGIQGTTTDGGNISTDPGEIAKSMSSYFEDLLNKVDNSSSRDPDLTPDPIRKLSSTEASLLTKDFSSEEIWQVIKDSDGNKAPGPDGFNGDFFKSFWYLIGSDITLAIQSFFLKGKILPQLNTTFISLIPKHPDACSPENYRPISLCNFLYKVISKMLANRLKPLMNQLISPFQSSFISDDVMIYADPNPPNASGILLCLHTFKLCSGLEFNPTKSEIFFASVENCIKRAICNILHIREGHLPIKYLGLPLVSSRLNSRDCQPIIDKIYWSGSFHIPAEVLIDIEKIIRNFIWSGPSLEKRYHPISWDIICRPKKEGGLGIRCLKDLNIAGQIKQLWKVVSGDKSPWVQWFHRKYIRNRSFWNISMPGNPSWAVRGIFRVRAIARKYICYIIGPNSNLLFWKDPWHPNGPLENQSSLSSISIPESATISDTISNGWWSLIHQHPYLSDLKAILVTSLFSSSTPSFPVWMPEADGTFSTKSAWNSIRSSHHPPDWVSSLWFPGHIPKFSFTAWQAIQDRLPTKDRLTFLPINADKRCLLCNSVTESVNHLFFSCSYSAWIWRIILKKISLRKKFKFKGQSGCLARILLTPSVYYIWLERNCRLHDKIKTHKSIILDRICRVARSRVLFLKLIDEVNEVNSRIA